MDIEMLHKPVNLSLYGVSGTAAHNNFAQTGMKLMGKMWEAIKLNNLSHKGINIWVYNAEGKLFTGVELAEIPDAGTGLEPMHVHLEKYLYYKLIGPYSLIPETYAKLKQEINEKDLKTCYPWLEIYGHWCSDETKLETEILIGIK